MKYFFILGKTPNLSIVELASFTNRLSARSLQTVGGNTGGRIGFANVSRILDKVAVVEAEGEIDVLGLMKALGGTVKIGEIWKEVKDFSQVKAQDLADFILKNCEPGKKIYFGISPIEGLSGVNKGEQGLSRVRKLGLEVKRLLKAKGVSSRFVTSKDENLSSVVVKKNKLVSKQGVEFVFIKTRMATNSKRIDTNYESSQRDMNGVDKILIGRTLAVQEFEEYSVRDYGRPSRDRRVGLLPPKLAQMMVNIAGLDLDKTILDPFCGSGTILQEAVLLGYKNVIGCDVSQRMVEASKQNLKWLSRQFGVSISDVKVSQCDAIQLSKKVQPNSIDAIVTEPYLGPPLKGGESQGKIEKITAELSRLYLQTFEEFKKVLKKNGVVVVIFPVFARQGGENVCVDILDEIKIMGFKSILGEGNVATKYCLILTTPRGSIIYSRPGQKVLREVFKFIQQIQADFL